MLLQDQRSLRFVFLVFVPVTLMALCHEGGKILALNIFLCLIPQLGHPYAMLCGV